MGVVSRQEKLNDTHSTMKRVFFLGAFALAFAVAKPSPSEDYDPDCEEVDTGVVEPIPEIDLNAPAQTEPPATIPQEVTTGYECEPTGAPNPANPCDDNPCLPQCNSDCSTCPSADKCIVVDPCVAEPCGPTCNSDCLTCPLQAGCDPCAMNPCKDGCEQPCDQCGYLNLDKCAEDSDCESDYADEAEPSINADIRASKTEDDLRRYV